MKISLGSLFILTTFVFFVLRVTGTTQWSYVWVFSPLWIPIAFFLTFGALLGLLFLVTLLGRYFLDFMTGRV